MCHEQALHQYTRTPRPLHRHLMKALPRAAWKPTPCVYNYIDAISCMPDETWCSNISGMVELLSVCLSVCLPVCLFVCLSVGLYNGKILQNQCFERLLVSQLLGKLIQYPSVRLDIRHGYQLHCSSYPRISLAGGQVIVLASIMYGIVSRGHKFTRHSYHIHPNLGGMVP